MKNSLISTNYLWYEFLCIFLFAISLFTFDSMWNVLEKNEFIYFIDDYEIFNEKWKQ